MKGNEFMAKHIKPSSRHGQRGKWFEAAIIATSVAYRQRGLGHIEQQPVATRQVGRDFIRQRSSVDFIGVIEGVPVAFDAKVTQQPSFPMRNVKPHQLEVLESFIKCNGVGFLLVCFERLDVSGTFAVSPAWLRTAMAALCRASIPAEAFQAAAQSPSAECWEVFHGEQGVPVHFAPAVWRLRLGQSGD